MSPEGNKFVKAMIDKFHIKHVVNVGAACQKTDRSHYEDFVTTYVGVDLSNSPGNDNLVVYEGPLPFADCTVSHILLVDVLEHTHLPELLMDEIYRVLKYTGKVITVNVEEFKTHEDWYTDYRRYYYKTPRVKETNLPLADLAPLFKKFDVLVSEPLEHAEYKKWHHVLEKVNK